MAAYVYRAKFSVPRLPSDYLARPRLDARWDQWRDCRLVTVVAGAGSGKTTFLAARAQAVGERALWYALDDLDRDPAVMAANLGAACGRPAATSLDELVAPLVSEGRTAIFLDDAQFVAGADEVRRFLQRLLRYLPDGSQLVLGAREPIELPTARWQTQGMVGALAGRDLAFTPDEIGACFARRFAGASLAPADRERLAAATEGWAAGLEIFWQSLPGPQPPQVAAALSQVELGSGGWFDYFVEEVITQLTPRTRDFLLRAAVLPRLEPALCDDALERRGSERVLRELERRQLFTYRIGASSYRFHHLFRDCLLALLAGEASAAERRRLRRRVAATLARRGDDAEACLMLVDAGDTARAVAMLGRRAEHLLATRQYGVLRQILSRLPREALAADADVLYVQGHLDLLQGRWKAAETAIRRVLALAPTPARRARAAALLCQVMMQTGRWEACLREGRRQFALGDRVPPAVRADLLGTMGVCACSLGRIARGRVYFDQARRICRRAHDREGEGRHLSRLAANVGCITGDLAEARDAAEQAVAVFREVGRRELLAHSVGVLGFVHACRGDERRARELTEEALREARGIGYRNIEGYCQLTLGLCDLLADDASATASRFENATGIAIDLGERALQTWATLGLTETAWRLGAMPAARARAEQARTLAERQRDQFCAARARLWLGRVAANDHDEAAARTHWAAATRALTSLGARTEAARLDLWRLEANLARDRTADGVTSLLTRLEGDGLAFVADRLESRTTAAILDRAPAADPVVARWRGRLGLAAPPRNVPAPPVAHPPLVIRALGPLVVERDGEVLRPATWPSGRARRLLQLLLVHRFQPVARDQVLEMLWPDADPDRGALSLRQSLHVLRRQLEPPDASSPIHVLASGGTLQLDPGEDASYDVLDFEGHLRRAQADVAAARTEAAIRHLRAAVDLYRGELFADSPYERFAEEESAQLRHRFRRAVARLTELLASQRRWDDVVVVARRGQADDPLDEDLACHIASALLALGHRQEALAECHRFEALHVRELDLLPSVRVKTLAERAIRGGR